MCFESVASLESGTQDMTRRTLFRALLGGGLASWCAVRGSDWGISAESQAPAERSRGRALARGPIIDVHMHAYPPEEAIPPSANRVTGKPHTLKNGEEHMQV